MTAHRSLHDDVHAPHVGIDPGAGGTFNIDRDHVIFDIVSATAETRILPVPPASGLRVVLNLKDDGGDVTITQTNGAFNATGNNTVTLDDNGDNIELISLDMDGTLRWRVAGDGGGLSTV